MSEERTRMSSPILLIGIGNEYRSDDSIGLHVIRALKEEKLPETMMVESSGDGAELIELFSTARMAILIDAVSSGRKPGTIYQFEAHKQPVPAQISFQSTHAFGVGEAIELARVLDNSHQFCSYMQLKEQTSKQAMNLLQRLKKPHIRLPNRCEIKCKTLSRD